MASPLSGFNAARKCEITPMERQPIRTFPRVDHLIGSLCACGRALLAIAYLVVEILEHAVLLCGAPHPASAIVPMCDAIDRVR